MSYDPSPEGDMYDMCPTADDNSVTANRYGALNRPLSPASLVKAAPRCNG